MGDNDNIKIVIQKWFNNSADWQKDLFKFVERKRL